MPDWPPAVGARTSKCAAAKRRPLTWSWSSYAPGVIFVVAVERSRLLGEGQGVAGLGCGPGEEGDLLAACSF